MMENEFKHLAAYLPYALKVSINQEAGTYNQKYPVRVIGFDLGINDKVLLHVIDDGIKLPFFVNLEDVKPILRPLSDIQLSGFEFYTTDMITNSIKFGEMAVKLWAELIEHHFDVFGLIPAGLAIDINTLKP